MYWGGRDWGCVLCSSGRWEYVWHFLNCIWNKIAKDVGHDTIAHMWGEVAQCLSLRGKDQSKDIDEINTSRSSMDVTLHLCILSPWFIFSKTSTSGFVFFLSAFSLIPSSGQDTQARAWFWDVLEANMHAFEVTWGIRIYPTGNLRNKNKSKNRKALVFKFAALKTYSHGELHGLLLCWFLTDLPV